MTETEMQGRFGLREAADGTLVIYDNENGEAWLRSTTFVSLSDRR